MKIAHAINDVRKTIKGWKSQNKSIGLVATMGYLHEGHESLIRKAKEENDYVVVSIFVNPTQFAPNEDLSSYPRDFEKDTEICERLGATLIFHPDPMEVYPTEFYTFVDINTLSKNLCGKSRPTHFRGVCTVVAKLFNIITPDRAYFGEKDAQQLAIIRQMVRDLNIDIEIVGCPIVREEDGLAKSSRNSYLSEKERKSAVVVNKSLLIGKKLLEQGERNSKIIIDSIANNVNKEGLAKIDYINIVDKDTLQDVERVENSVLIAVAIFIGKTRLIDNFTFESDYKTDV